MNSDKSIHLDDTFEEIASSGDSPTKLPTSPIASRIPIGHGEYLVRVHPDRNESSFLYEDPDCPYWAYEGSPDCDGLCVFVPDYDENSTEPVFLGWNECCFGCGPDQYCRTPSLSSAYYRYLFRQYPDYSGVITECEDEYEGVGEGREVSVPEEIRTALDSFRSDLPVSSRRGFLKIPSIYDPGSFSGRYLQLGHETLRLNMPRQGWRICVTPNFLPQSDERFPSTSVVTQYPRVIPTDTIDLQDEALSACIILPESDGSQQHWVSIPESSRHPQSPFRYAHLATPGWSVTLFRLPLPSEKSRNRLANASEGSIRDDLIRLFCFYRIFNSDIQLG